MRSTSTKAEARRAFAWSLASAFVGVGRISTDEERFCPFETGPAVLFYLWCVKRLSLRLFIL